MPNTALQAAIRQAYAQAPAGEVILHTLELRHPAFIDGLGNPTAVRVVRDRQAITARLEASAPIDGGELVEFVPFAFDFKLPDVDTDGAPELELVLDNVTRDLVDYIELALATRDPITATYRPYLSTDTEGPQMDPPLHMQLGEVTVDVFKVVGRARLDDLVNRSFPGWTYTAEKFPGLIR